MAKRHQRLTGVVTAGALALLGTRLVLGRIRAMSFRGAVVLVTGGSRGLGLLLAREFGRRGATSRSARVTPTSWSALGSTSSSVGWRACLSTAMSPT